MPENIQRKKPRKPPTHKLKVEQLLAIKKANPNITNRQLAKLTDADASSITKCFQRYGISQEHLASFKTNRADIMAGMQETVLASFNPETINNASVKERTMLFGVLYDKERLERGLSTSNQAVIYASAVELAFKGSKQASAQSPDNDNDRLVSQNDSQPVIEADYSAVVSDGSTPMGGEGTTG